MIGVLHLGRHPFAQQAFYVPQIGPVLGTAERNSVAICPCPGSPPYTVHVGLGLYGKIIVDHVGHADDVNAA